MNTNNIFVPWRRITATAIAIAVGAMVLSAPSANADLFETNCVQNPATQHPDALSGVLRVVREDNDRYEYCDVYSVEGIPPDRRPGGTGYLATHAHWHPNWYQKPPGVPPRVSQPPRSPQG